MLSSLRYVNKREEMARRRNRESFLEVALEGNWTVAAVIAVALSVGYLLLPSLLHPSPTLAPAISIVRKIMGMVALVFGGIAFVKFLWGRFEEKSDVQLQPIMPTPTFDTSPRHPKRVPVWDSPSSKPSTPDKSSTHNTSTWSIDLLQAIEWKRYEDLCAAFYREKGIRSETTPLGADGGVDVRLYQDENNPQATAIVQCKAWGERQVGVKPVRELLGVMAHEKIAKGFFMAPGGFTEEAREFAKANAITLLDGKLFLAMLERLPEEKRERLLSFATEGDFITPSCPSCGIKMIKRNGKNGDFWGCRNYPRCRQTLHSRKV